MKRLLNTYLNTVNESINENLFSEYKKILGKILKADENYAVFKFTPNPSEVNLNTDLLQEINADKFLNIFLNSIETVSIEFKDNKVNFKYISSKINGLNGNGNISLADKDKYSIKNAKFILRNIIKTAYKEFIM